MQDVPPEISVALSVVQALTASGRCREDAGLYASAAALLKQYLESAIRPAVPPTAGALAHEYMTDTVKLPPPASVWVAAPPTAAPAAVLAPTPAPSAPPRPDALWHGAVGVWVIPKPGAGVLPTPPTPPPRPGAVWHDGLQAWLVDRASVG